MGNLASAGLVPLMVLLKDPETQSMSKANWVLALSVGVVGLFYLSFSGAYRRMEADREYEERRNAADAAVAAAARNKV